MSRFITQHVATVRTGHPEFLSGPMPVNLYQHENGHYFVRIDGRITANYMTHQMAEQYIQNFIHDVGGFGLFDRIKALQKRLGITLLASKHICEANLDSLMTGDYAADINLLAKHLRKD